MRANPKGRGAGTRECSTDNDRRVRIRDPRIGERCLHSRVRFALELPRREAPHVHVIVGVLPPRGSITTGELKFQAKLVRADGDVADHAIDVVARPAPDPGRSVAWQGSLAESFSSFGAEELLVQRELPQR